MVKAGDVLENPVTGERLVVRRVVLDDPGGEQGEGDLYIKHALKLLTKTEGGCG
jgi:hypothetical protein